MKRHIYITFLSTFLFFISCSDYTKKNLNFVVKNGFADISGEELSSGKIISLNGTWEFYYKELLEPDDFQSQPLKNVTFLEVPDDWDHFLYEGKRIGSYNYGTYRVKIYTGNDNTFYFRLMPPNSAYKIWINGIFFGECGRVGKKLQEEIPEWKLPIFEVTPVNRNVEIVIQVSNYSIYLGGMVLPPLAGSREKIYESQDKNLAFDIFIFASILVISVYYLGLFMMRKSDRSHLFFSIFTFMLSIRSLVTNELFLFQLFPDVKWEILVKIDFLATTLCVPVFIYFIYLLYPVAVKRGTRRFFIISSIIYSSMILFLPCRIYSEYLPVYNIITIIGCLVTIDVLFKAIKDKQEGAKLALVGFMVLFITVINDILSVNSILHTIQLSSFGVFSYILMQSFISSMKFANAYKHVEDLSHNLEIKVRKRTRELEEEKELLRIRNETIENELSIARKIQKQIIPSRSPVENISAFYKPMDMVGGDFYDFLKYRNPDKIGIFLSDVSGHGVAAAFITSMVKTCILQAGTDREDPSTLLSSLNELLINQTGGHFVTAFYGIYSPATREFVYSNSGHNPPFLISGGTIKTINGKKSIPLAIVDNDMLRSLNKAGSNNFIILEKGDRILFYTDGLTETSSYYDKNLFFETHLVDILIQKYSLSSAEDFILNIYNELIRFHGSDSFEDDICMICMDVI